MDQNNYMEVICLFLRRMLDNTKVLLATTKFSE